MTSAERSALLHFSTGSVRAPAVGFRALMGYHGQQQPFTIKSAPSDDVRRLPTASTCFNTVYLPPYTSAIELGAKLRKAIAGARGFAEAAIADA
jgi:ubiquitin-protein ligase E3 C